MNELLTRLTSAQRCAKLLAQVAVPPQLAGDKQLRDRAAVAMALGLVLFEDLLARVLSGARYVASQREQGRQVVFDHGAVRTVDWHQTGQLPPGAELFRRLLIPLGYQEVGRYPLDRIHLTVRVFTHADLPEQVPQYFVSELHVDRLEPEAQQAVTRTVGDSVDPLDGEALALLDDLAGRGWVTLDDHPDPRLDDYQTLPRHSAEMAWIATKGNAFNHAADRVRQTALRADPVLRRFRDADGASITREVPGSFFEFITRDVRPAGGLDLTFDAGNAQGIFRMTAHRPVGAPSSTTNPGSERLSRWPTPALVTARKLSGSGATISGSVAEIRTGRCTTCLDSWHRWLTSAKGSSPISLSNAWYFASPRTG